MPSVPYSKLFDFVDSSFGILLNTLCGFFEYCLPSKSLSSQCTYSKSSQRALDELQRTIVEIETKYKAEISRLKKKYETEIREYEIQVETLTRTNAELAKNNKALSGRVKVSQELFQSSWFVEIFISVLIITLPRWSLRICMTLFLLIIGSHYKPRCKQLANLNTSVMVYCHSITTLSKRFLYENQYLL